MTQAYTFQEFTGLEYLKIDVASNYGLDKKKWSERIDWFNHNETRLENLVSFAEEPALYYAGVKAYRDAVAGIPIGYMISLDATSSGIQILSCLTGDEKAASICNVIDTGNRENAYAAIYGEMCNRLGETTKIDPDDTKKAIMTSFYTSTAEPKRVFGEGALLDIFYATLHDMAPAAWELNEQMPALWNPNGLSHDWILPDNFHVKVKVMGNTKQTVHFLNENFDIITKENMPLEEGRSLGANIVHSIDGFIVREIKRRCEYDPKDIERIQQALTIPPQPILKDKDSFMVQTLWDHYRQSGYLSARILKYLKSTNLFMVDRAVIKELLASLPAKPFTVISIHDCFRLLPHYGNDIRRQYNLQLMLIAKSEMLSFIVSQLVGKHITVQKRTPDLYKSIIDTNYALS